MSTFRKTVLTTAIIGAGLAATSGSAFASDHHESHESKASSGCSNLVKSSNENGAGEVRRGSVTGGDQAISPSNICNNFSGNDFANGNNLAGGNITNGDTTSVNKSETSSVTKSLSSVLDLGF